MKTKISVLFIIISVIIWGMNSDAIAGSKHGKKVEIENSFNTTNNYYGGRGYGGYGRHNYGYGYSHGYNRMYNGGYSRGYNSGYGGRGYSGRGYSRGGSYNRVEQNTVIIEGAPFMGGYGYGGGYSGGFIGGGGYGYSYGGGFPCPAPPPPSYYY